MAFHRFHIRAMARLRRTASRVPETLDTTRQSLCPPVRPMLALKPMSPSARNRPSASCTLDTGFPVRSEISRSVNVGLRRPSVAPMTNR